MLNIFFLESNSSETKSEAIKVESVQRKGKVSSTLFVQRPDEGSKILR